MQTKIIPGEGTYTINGKAYPVAGYVTDGEKALPLVDTPMMNDYTWMLGCLQGRLADRELYAQFGDVDAEIEYLRGWLAEHAPSVGGRLIKSSSKPSI